VSAGLFIRFVVCIVSMLLISADCGSVSTSAV